MCVLWIRAFALGLVVVAAIGSACSPPNEAGRSAGARITVLAVMGPITPVCRADMTCSAAYRGRVVLRSSSGQELVVVPDRRGHAVVSLAPGTYEIGESAGVAFPRLASVTLNTHPVGRDAAGRYEIRVLPGRDRLRLVFDTGIR